MIIGVVSIVTPTRGKATPAVLGLFMSNIFFSKQQAEQQMIKVMLFVHSKAKKLLCRSIHVRQHM